MPYLIDGHNLIGKMPELNLKAIDDEVKLVKMLQRFCLVSRKSVEVYFDDAPPGYSGLRQYGMVKAHFVRQGQTADDAITAHLRRLGRAAANWTLVSSDRQVQKEARSLGAQVISSEEFSQQVSSAQEARQKGNESDSGELSAEEVQEWLDLFGINGKEGDKST